MWITDSIKESSCPEPFVIFTCQNYQVAGPQSTRGGWMAGTVFGRDIIDFP